MKAIRTAIGDAVLTFMWVFCASTIATFTSIISGAVGAQGTATLFITTVIVFILVFTFTIVGGILGGASFNPSGTTAFYAAGFGSGSLITTAMRFPAQAAGAVGGALSISQLMPKQYRHMIGGPSLKVDLHTGAMAEGFLTFALTFSVLLIFIRGPRSLAVKTWLMAMATVALVVAGAPYTGPSMNPANAFGWAYVKKRHDKWDHFYVYWICPFIGATLAGWIFRVVYPPLVKQKKA